MSNEEVQHILGVLPITPQSPLSWDRWHCLLTTSSHAPSRGQNSESFFKFQCPVLYHVKENMYKAKQVNIIRGSFQIGFVLFLLSFFFFFFFCFRHWVWMTQHKVCRPLMHSYMDSFVGLFKTSSERPTENKTGEQTWESGFQWGRKQVGTTKNIPIS